MTMEAMPHTAPRTSARPLAEDFRQTLGLALPLIFAELGWMSMGLVDTIMVGRLPDSAIAIGATGLGQSLYHMLAIFGGGLLLGMDTFVSQAHGRNDLRDARFTLVNGLALALALTPLLMLAVSCWPFLMRSFGISLELVGPMRPFLSALNWGTLPLLVYFALRRYLQARDVALPITFALVSANIVNAVGDYALIYGHLGFRAYGIVGSGWSTVSHASTWRWCSASRCGGSRSAVRPRLRTTNGCGSICSGSSRCYGWGCRLRHKSSWRLGPSPPPQRSAHVWVRHN